MEGEIDENATLDCAVFHISPTENSYEALACSEGKMEKIVSGPLDQLGVHLLEAKECHSHPSDTSFNLQVAESEKEILWFTKATLARFLHIVNSPEPLEVANALEVEMSQLEETKKFHISLYAKDQDRSASGPSDSNCLREVGINQQIKVETASSDATKNELLRALDLRLMALEEELSASFNRAAGATCSAKQISDLSEFARHFGAVDLRDFLLKILARRPKNCTEPLGEQPLPLQGMKSSNENKRPVSSCPAPRTDVAKPVGNVISPAKIAQAERQSSSEDGESSESSDEDKSHSERSRSMIRSATPRRSASPMRRIQIGRSGSRRSTSLTIKSLNYFPPRERTVSVRDAGGSSSGDEENDQPTKKPENPVRRMSVQDAISLFESKQKDQNSDVQKRRATGEVSSNTTAKSVLRRWSSGMGDSLANSSHETASEALPPQDTREEIKSAEVKVESSNIDESPQVSVSLEMENSVSSPLQSAEPVSPKVEEVDDRATASAEWARQKETELNQMLMKMMENKPGKHRGTNGGTVVQQDVSIKQRGGFYSQYREKRDEKLRAENAEKRAVKEEQFKVMKETLKQSKVNMASKPVTATRKQDPPNSSQRPRRNSSPPVLPNKEVMKPTATRKASPKTSPLPTTRSSWSSGPLPKTSATPSPKASSGNLSTNSTISRRKSLSTPRSSQLSPKTERPVQPTKGKGTSPDTKPSLKGQEVKKQASANKSSKSVKTKSPAAPGDDSTMSSAKPSLYNKVTKKNSVVPLESKPFLKKGTGISPRVGPVVVKAKVPQPFDSPKSTGSLIQAEANVSNAMTAEPTPKVVEAEVLQLESHDVDIDTPPDNDNSHDLTKSCTQGRDELDNGLKNKVLPVPEIQADEDMGISSAAWVEVEHQEGSDSCINCLPELATSPEIASATALSSPRVRHSLSQMLQADNEPEIIEWGNAENPPALVYHKDAPKGLKRLLKFARKSKAEANMTGWASPSVFSEGEEDAEESKAANKRSSDALLRKAALQAKGYEPPKSTITGNFDGGNSSMRSMDYQGMHDTFPAQSAAGTATILDRLREGQSSASATSSKTTRSFFSLSTFRSSKSSETKLR